jgi:hypothetical protein
MNRRELLNDQDVISVDDKEKIVINHKTFTVKEFLDLFFADYFSDDTAKKWFFDGVDCELLAPGKNWRKGKIKITLEFIPDEVESPLDEIRREMRQDLEN